MLGRTSAITGLFCALLIFGQANAQTAADVDFDGSGLVDFNDFIFFASAYGSTESRYDLDKDGVVGFGDFLVFAEVFGQRVTPSPPGDNSDKTATLTLIDSTKMDFVFIAPGTFALGSPNSDSSAFSSEKPQHQVTISHGFYLGKYEVTQGQWKAVMGTAPWTGDPFVQTDNNNPAADISWNDARAFVTKLNTAAGDSLYRLPSEAEWEYACRAGTTTRWSFGDDEALLKDYAWYYDNAWAVGEAYAHKVGTKKPNPWGLYDMHGNVFEWVQDWYEPYVNEAQTDPQGPSSGTNRVDRGGDFSSNAEDTRSANRVDFTPSIRGFFFGFRLLRMVK